MSLSTGAGITVQKMKEKQLAAIEVNRTINMK